MKKQILINVLVFGAGVCVGYFLSKGLKKEEVKESVEETPEHTYKDADPGEGAYVPDVKEEDVKLFDKSNWHPAPPMEVKVFNASPVDDEEEEEEGPEEDDDDLDDEEEELRFRGKELTRYREKHKGEIILISESELEEHPFKERVPIYYFPDDGLIADEVGEQLDMFSYVGNCFDKIGFYTSEDEECRIRNFVKEMDIIVHKVTDVPYSMFYGI